MSTAADDMLQIADDFALPLDAITQTFALLAVRGSGKTYAAAVIVEEFLKKSLPVCVLDPVGVWYGLRSNAAGDGPGLPIVVFGGDHADVPLPKLAGAAVAQLIVEQRIPAILDLSHFLMGEQDRFVTDFAEALYRLNRAPLHLVFDEADAFAPQSPQPGQQRMLGAMENIVRRGRARGLGVTLITQRPAVLNKNVLTQIQALFVLRITSPNDRKAIKSWVEAHGTTEQLAELERTLATLPTGTGWFWSPGWLDEFRQIRIRRRDTFDSSKTPTIGAAAPPIAAVDVATVFDLAALTERIGIPEPDAIDDLKTARNVIKDLRAQLSVQAAAPTEPLLIPVFDKATAAVVLESIGSIELIIAGIADRVLAASGGRSANGPPAAGPLDPDADARRPTSLPLVLQDAFGEPDRTVFFPIRRPGDDGLDDVAPRPLEAGGRRTPPESPAPHTLTAPVMLKAGERRMLDTLRRLNDCGLTPQQLGHLARMAPGSGTWNQYFAHLRRAGELEERAGRLYAAKHPAAGMPPHARVKMWDVGLKAGELRILQTLIDTYPHTLTPSELGGRANVTPGSGTWNQYVAHLRRLELITGRDALAAVNAPWFPIRDGYPEAQATG